MKSRAALLALAVVSYGGASGADAGADGRVRDDASVPDRLYQLVRQKGEVRERSFAIEFLDPGVQAFAFTFG